VKKTLWFVAVGLGMGLLAAVSCRRSDLRVAIIDVPQMTGDRAIRIVTNATLDEIVGRYDGTQHGYEIDLSKKLILYHEGQRLCSREYQRRIEARLGEVGFEAHVVGVHFNPTPPVPTEQGLVQMWPNRYTAVLSIPALASNTDANRVVDAIAYARIGGDDPRISVRRDSREVVATYESLNLSLQNIEYAIACAGFTANDIPANLGANDALPHGWTPVKL
jgi:hypothetical protein